MNFTRSFKSVELRVRPELTPIRWSSSNGRFDRLSAGFGSLSAGFDRLSPNGVWP
jgi:hypothetical protein